MTHAYSPDPNTWPQGEHDFALDGGVAVVTGAASGLGRAIAEGCAALRMRLVLADIDEAGLQSAKAELESRTECIGTKHRRAQSRRPRLAGG